MMSATIVLLVALVLAIYLLGRTARTLERRVVERTALLEQRMQELAVSQAWARGVLDSALDCIITLDREGKILEFNPAAEKTFGCASADVIGKEMTELLFPPCERENQRPNLGLGKRIETTALRAGGKEFPVELAVTAHSLEGGPAYTAYLRDISEPKRAQEQLLQKTSELQAIIQAFPDLYYRLDATGRILNYDSGRQSGFYSLSSETGTRIHDLVPPGERPQLDQALRQVSETATMARMEYASPRQDGQRPSFEARLLPLVNGQILAIVRDISDRKRAEGRLATQLAAARILAESATLAEAAPKVLQTVCEGLGWQVGVFWTVDRSANVLRCLEIWQQPSVSAGELEAASRRSTLATGAGLPGRVWSSGKPIWIDRILGEASFPRAQVAAEAGLHAAYGLPIASSGEVHGVLEFFSCSGQAPDEQQQGMLAACGSQIGQFLERKRGEEVRLQLASIVESSNDAIISLSLEGRIRTWNSAAEKFYGYSAEEAIGQSIAILGHPERTDALIALAAKIKRGELVTHYETEHIKKDGSQRHVSLTLSPISADDGKISRVAIIARDITARKRAEAAWKRAKEAAEAANRAKSEFLANMSHEIRTPMNGIMGMTELVLDTQLTAQQRDYLNIVKVSAESLLTVIDDILDFSKIEAGKLVLDPIGFHLENTLNETLRPLALRAHKKGLELACHIQPDVPERLVGDVGRLRQIIVNLVGNAIKFTDHGEVVVQVQAEAPTPDNVLLHFAVKDTGIGIPAEKQRLIFDPFVQADGSMTRKYGGTGLGLAISSKLIDLMGGRLWVDSEVGKGSTFHCTARFAVQRRSECGPLPSKPPALDNLPVLVVDDNATNRRILQEMLLSWHMRPTAVDSGQAALAELSRAAASGEAFPLVLLDAMMPDMDGFALAEQMRRQPQLAGATIMMLTSADRAGDLARSRELGVVAYLTKPIKRSELLDAIVSSLALSGVKCEGTEHVSGNGRPQPGRPFRRLRILLAEDNVINQTVAVELLHKQGHTVVVTGNGREAVTALGKQSFDVVLMDVQMPEMDGFEAVAAIRAREKTRGDRLPIIALTAHAMKGDRERCLNAGFDGYVCKPVQANELFQAIELLTCPVPASDMPPKQAAEGPATAVGFDKNVALNRVNGNLPLLQKLATLFLSERPHLMGEIGDGIATRDARKLERAAHTLKGSVGYFGVAAAVDAALKLESMGRSGDLEGALETFRTLEETLERLQPELAALGLETVSV